MEQKITPQMGHRVSHVQKVRSQYSYDRTQVLWLTKMTEEELFDFQFDTGLDWLKRYTGDDKQLLFELLQQPHIWGWWKNEWSRRDHLHYLPALYAVKYPVDRAARYRAMHQEVFIKYAPPSNYLEQSYAVAVGLMFDSKKAI